MNHHISETGNTKNEARKLSSFTVILVFVLLSLIGISFLPLVNLQLKPSRALQSISVTYQWPRASAKVIEQEVTSKLEGLFGVINGVEEISSQTSQGEGEIEINLKKKVNLDAVRFELASTIRQVYPTLPVGVSYPVLSLGTSGRKTQPLMTYTLNGNASPRIIQKYAEDHLVGKIASIKGVSEVNVYGATPFEWEVEYDYDKIHALDLTADQIVQAINQHSENRNLGLVSQERGKRIYTIPLMVKTQHQSHQFWEGIPVSNQNGRIIYLEDIARVRLMEQQPNSYYRINGLNTINLVIYASDHENQLRLAAEVKSKVSQLAMQLPNGYALLVAHDTTEFIGKELNKIGFRTLLSMVILLSFVLVISRQWKYLLLIVISLFANLIIAVIFYYVLKLEIHLYSLAGLTISFGIIIDNTIVMVDHYHHHKNRKVLLAILAASITTIGALSMVFLLEESQRVNLVDFAFVIAINLSVSVLIALFFIPALMDKIRLRTRKKAAFTPRKRRVIRMTAIYGKGLLFFKNYSWVMIILIILGFGIPVHWLPEKLEGGSSLDSLYNKTIGGDLYQETLRPYSEKILGGSIRLFTEYVFESSFYAEPERTTLYVRGTMPEGCTVQQLNEVILKMENFISQYDEVESFQTSIYSYNNSSIRIQFKKAHEFGGFPYFLKDAITGKAISLGGLDWGVYGVGRGFSNAIGTGYKNSSIKLEGYNYEQLYAYADMLGEWLLENPRIKEFDLQGDNGWRVRTLHEYNMEFDHESLARNGATVTDYYSKLRDRINFTSLNPVFHDGESHAVNLKTSNTTYAALWHFKNEPLHLDSSIMKLKDVASIEKKRTGNDIFKKNQQYQLFILYDFIGPGKLSQIVRDEYIEKMKAHLPLGYKVSDGRDFSFMWNKKDQKQYYLIFMVMAIIFVICSILLESFRQPMAIISMIPISFIGVFLTFYLLDINFDQGGFASFILLSGLVVNAGLYIINDFNNLKKQYPRRKVFDLYLKAYNQKIIPVLLTVVSSVLGLIPFIWQGQNEVFWFAFASGAIGGLLFSFVALWIYLPLFLRLKGE
jgi:multidrug efflux pump subunit AcrB